MGPGYFVIAILGCADGGTACTPVTTLQPRYESAAQCTAATAAVLEGNNNFDFPTLIASCRRGLPRPRLADRLGRACGAANQGTVLRRHGF